jgi:hypothetical protein
MNNGDYSTAFSKADDLGSGKPDWSDYLLKLIAVETNTVDGIYSLNSNGTDRSFIWTYASTDNMDGQASAQALLEIACDSLFSEPHALPEGEEDSRIFVPQNALASSEETEESIRIYPNPAQSVITVSYSSTNPGKARVEIRDLLGKLIYTNFISNEKGTLYVPLEHLEKGLYLVTLSRNGKTIRAEKLIKE